MKGMEKGLTPSFYRIEWEHCAALVVAIYLFLRGLECVTIQNEKNHTPTDTITGVSLKSLLFDVPFSLACVMSLVLVVLPIQLCGNALKRATQRLYETLILFISLICFVSHSTRINRKNVDENHLDLFYGRNSFLIYLL